MASFRDFCSRHRVPIYGVSLFIEFLAAITTTSAVLRVLALISFVLFAVALVMSVVENTKRKREALDSP